MVHDDDPLAGAEHEPITPRQFHQSDGLEDWRMVGLVACASFRTASLAESARLVQAISELAVRDGQQPDLDVRGECVVVRLLTQTGEYYGLTAYDVDLARRISAAARELGTPADPAAVQNVVVTVDALEIPDVLPFWQAVLGYKVRADTPGEELIDPLRRGPILYFNQLEAPRPERNRIHFDVFVPHQQAKQRVAATIAAGGRLVSDQYAPSWWVLADAEGNEACIATW
jgi:4a-hydroxytetrahydrobiopterin dehydratase